MNLPKDKIIDLNWQIGRFNVQAMLALISIATFFHCANFEHKPPAKISASLHVPDGYSVELVAGPDLVDYPMFATLDPDGRLFVFESIGNIYEKSQQAVDTPRFRIKLLEDLDRDGLFDQAMVFADSLSFPQGGVFHKGSLYATSAPDLLKLTDTNGDGRADQKEVILSGWTLNVNANSLIGPFLGPDGWLYMTSAIMGFDVDTKEGEHLTGETARIWRVKPDGSGLEWVSAGGMNNPVELTFTTAGEVLGTQTFFVNPQRGLRDALTFWVEGGVYGKKNSNITRDNLPRTGELLPVVSSYSRVAPSGIMRYRSSILGEAFQNNLFTAQFNTHRVLNHTLNRIGASFETEDQVFLWSDDVDFHPTDVLEAGDGSLLVVETGGWFILGCPLSQVSKPQRKGSIYRITPDDKHLLQDPYGEYLNFRTMSPDDLVGLLEYDRPFVVDKAVSALKGLEELAVESLGDFLENSAHGEARAKAIFILHQLNVESSRSIVRNYLSDRDVAVCIAAARSCGLAKDQGSISGLVELLRSEVKACRRQSATSLGQIGDVSAIPDLLTAAAGENDPFLIHAITYALINMNAPELITQGLSHQNAVVRNVAIKALDEHANYDLRWAQLLPFLEGEDIAAQLTALSIAQKHPEWSRSMHSYIDKSLHRDTIEAVREEMLRELLINFCGSDLVQQVLAKHFSHGSADIKKFTLDIMKSCSTEHFPIGWKKLLAAELRDPYGMRLAILDLLQHRQVADLDTEVRQISSSPKTPLELRMKAIQITASPKTLLPKNQFDYLWRSLQEQTDLTVHQKITDLFLEVSLTKEQTRLIIMEYLPQAEDFMLPKLMPLLASSDDLNVGLALCKLLHDSPALDNISEDQIRNAFKNMPDQIRPYVAELIEEMKVKHSVRLTRLEKLEEAISAGDEGRGRKLYFGKATCWTCHRMGSEGSDLGPDLTSIQKDRSQHDILEAILYPNVSFVREYESYIVRTKGQSYTGIIVEQNPEFIILGLAPHNSIRLERTEIVDIHQSNVSLMPQGFGGFLTKEEIADLMAFLLGQDLIY
ncbi:MAG: c-type cytochrome [Saprospiraceae bacterium]|nr:c-type cytochrome [Saprospiraceae bacterium]